MTDGQEMLYKAKLNCKTCYGRGFITRTRPTGGKKRVKGKLKSEMVSIKTLCPCATEIKQAGPDRESNITDEEIVVPTVVDGMKRYANKTVPNFKGG